MPGTPTSYGRPITTGPSPLSLFPLLLLGSMNSPGLRCATRLHSLNAHICNPTHSSGPPKQSAICFHEQPYDFIGVGVGVGVGVDVGVCLTSSHPDVCTRGYRGVLRLATNRTAIQAWLHTVSRGTPSGVHDQPA